jgi:hypothetical protein
MRSGTSVSGFGPDGGRSTAKDGRTTQGRGGNSGGNRGTPAFPPGFFPGSGTNPGFNLGDLFKQFGGGGR